MDLARVHAVITALQAQGKRVSVRHLHAYTGGSFRDVSRLLREARATRTDATTPDPVPFSPVADFLRACCILDPAQSTSRLHLKSALAQWWDVTGTRVSWATLKQALHRRGCHGAHGGHIWAGVWLRWEPHTLRLTLPMDDALPPCTVCKQTAWRSRYRDDVLECGRCRATALAVRAWVLRVQSRSATDLELTLQHPGGVVTATGNRQQVRALSTLRSGQGVIAWGNVRRTGPSASDVVFRIVALCDGGK